MKAVSKVTPPSTTTLKFGWQRSQRHLFAQVIGTIVALFDEKKMNFGGERRLKSECRVERDDGRSRFSALVFAGSRKSVDVKNLRESALAEDDHPRLEIAL